MPETSTAFFIPANPFAPDLAAMAGVVDFLRADGAGRGGGGRRGDTDRLEVPSAMSTSDWTLNIESVLDWRASLSAAFSLRPRIGPSEAFRGAVPSFFTPLVARGPDDVEGGFRAVPLPLRALVAVGFLGTDYV